MALDLYSIVTGEDPQASSDARALAAALRAQRGSAMLDQVSASPAARAAAPMLLRDADAQGDMLARAPEARLKMAMEKANVQRMNEDMAARNDPAYAAAMNSFIRSVDPKIADAAQGSKPYVLDKIAGLAEKKYGVDTANAARVAAAAQAHYWRGAQQDETDQRAKQIGDSIINGQQQPDMKGLFRFGGPVRAYLASQGYDLATATNEWGAMQKYLAAANGPSQVRMAQAVSMIPQQVAKIRYLYDQWKQMAPVSGIKQFNRGAIFAAKQTGGDLGALANALDAQIADLTSELGFVYTGGNAPTDHSFKLAGQNLSANWDEASFDMALKNIEDAARYRKNAMGSTGPMGVQGNRYGQQQPSSAPPVPRGGSDLRAKYGIR